jgi:hypothetical protein
MRAELLHEADKGSHSRQPVLNGLQMLASPQTRQCCEVSESQLLTVPAYLLMWDRTTFVRKWGGL